MNDRFSKPLVVALTLALTSSLGCEPTESSTNKPEVTPVADGESEHDDATPHTSGANQYSSFGTYQGLPQWSDWCGDKTGASAAACVKKLTDAVAASDPSKQTSQSRPTVRGHGWHLWAAAWSALSAGSARNDAIENKTNVGGTTGCWSTFADKDTACSGYYPIWMTWPNTGAPYANKNELGAALVDGTTQSDAAGKTLLAISRSHGFSDAGLNPDPTKTQTVNTQPAPVYNLPPRVLSKQCNISDAQAKKWLDAKEYKKISAACAAAGAANMFCDGAICDGTTFINQGDVMIATESLSEEGYANIQGSKLYAGSGELKKMYDNKDNTISEKIKHKYVSTKHMFWPVKKCKPGAKVGDPECKVRYGALPPWVPAEFKKYNYATNANYLGYEEWDSVAAIDTCTGGAGVCPAASSASLELAHVTHKKSGKAYRPITTKSPGIYPVDTFSHIQISDEVLQNNFSAADRALLDQAAIWAYGDESNGFEAGDFLVVAAMHVVTKEIDTWAFQSVWWSPMDDKASDCPLNDYDNCFGQTAGYSATSGDSAQPNHYSGLTEAQIKTIDGNVSTRWRDNYLLTDSYGINYEIDGTRVKASNYFTKKVPTWVSTGPTGDPLDLLPVSMNVYVEPVIHPIGSNCQNCHRRAGYPGDACDNYPQGCGRSSEQTAQCAYLMGDYGDPAADPCMMKPWAWHKKGKNNCVQSTAGTTQCEANGDAYPVLNTDLIWIVADQHIQKQ